MNDEQRRIGGEVDESPHNVAEARAAVVDSRARISATLDELEERIVDKKEALRERLDLARPARAFIRAAPLLAVAAATGAGLLFGLITGGRGGSDGTIELRDVDREALERWRRQRRERLLDAADHELPSLEPPASRLGRLVRDAAHEFAGAAAALLVSQVVERVKEKERD